MKFKNGFDTIDIEVKFKSDEGLRKKLTLSPGETKSADVEEGTKVKMEFTSPKDGDLGTEDDSGEVEIRNLGDTENG